MENDISSTFLPSASQNGHMSTIKRIASAITPGASTDGNITYSIFDMPKENLERMEQEGNKEKNDNARDKNQSDE